MKPYGAFYHSSSQWKVVWYPVHSKYMYSLFSFHLNIKKPSFTFFFIFLVFYVPKSIDWGHIVFDLSVCPFLRLPICLFVCALPGWLSGKRGLGSGDRVGLMTWWLWVGSPIEANFLSGIFSPLTSEEACEKSSCGFRKKSCVSSGVSSGVRKSGSTLASPTTITWP